MRRLGDSFHISVESLHVPGNADEPNIFNLHGEELARREVKHVDIAEQPEEELGGLDVRNCVPTKAQRGPLKAGWQNTPEAHMCAYKLVRIKFNWGWGISSAVEKLIVSTEYNLFRELHLKAFLSLDAWHGLSLDDIRKIEQEAERELQHRKAGSQVSEEMASSPKGSRSPGVGDPPSPKSPARRMDRARSREDLFASRVMSSFSSDLERNVMSNSVMWRRSLSSEQDLERSALWQSCLQCEDEQLPAEVVSILGHSNSQVEIAASCIAAAWAGVAETLEAAALDALVGSSVGSFVWVEEEEEQEGGMWSDMGVNSCEAQLDESFRQADMRYADEQGRVQMDGSYLMPQPGEEVSETASEGRRNSSSWFDAGLAGLGLL